MLVLLEVSDVARELRLSSSGVLALVTAGKLQVYARSRRGVRYFTEQEVSRVLVERMEHPPQRGRRKGGV